MPPPDDVDDVTLHLDANADADVARLRETIPRSRDVRRALLFGDDQEISEETVRSVLQRWVSAYRDLTDQLREFDEARADELFADLREMREESNGTGPDDDTDLQLRNGDGGT